MPIPKEILEIERPANTVVYAYGKNKDRYGVKERVGCRRRNGKCYPVNGRTVGHIVDGRYVPSAPGPAGRVSASGYEVKDWANAALLDRVCSHLLGELGELYGEADALSAYCIAMLRVMYPGIKDCELKEAYDSSFLSEIRPGAALSRNSVSGFLFGLGKAYSRIISFMRRRAEAAGADARLLVDGTLKSDESRVNSLSDFSRKARVKGSRDISILYCFDVGRMEPVCSQCFPGNMLDATAYRDFIEKNGIKRGLIAADKGFPASAAAPSFEGNADLHYLNPVKRNSKLIGSHSMLAFEGVLKGYPGVSYKKARAGARWLYSFRDSGKAAKEDADFIARAGKEGYDHAEYLERRDRFGTVVFECDLDWPPEDVYYAYSRRWEIEVAMRYYKQSLELDETRVHSDLSVIGSEFVSFLSEVMTFDLMRLLEREKVLEDMTYGKVIKKLLRAKKVLVDGEWRPAKVNPSTEDLLRRLGVMPKLEEPPKGNRGRPRKSAV